MATSFNTQYDQFSATLAETFREVVDDNIMISNTVFEQEWEDAEQVAPGRYLSAPITSSKNQSATAFGMYDEVPVSPQALLTVATFPWSFYTVGIMLSYMELVMNRGVNQRVDNVAVQLDEAIGSIADLVGGDICTYPAKGQATQNAVNASGLIEATDDGTLVNTYGNILRTGGGSFANWQGNRIGKLTTGNIGNAANDAPISLFYHLYNLCTQGKQVPSEVYTTKLGVAAYMYALQAQQRFAAGDVANAGFAGAALFGSLMYPDDHIVTPTNGANYGCNYYAVNKRHTRFFYFGRKGVEFVDWMNSPQGAIAKIARYIMSFQFASTQPRTGGQLLNVNALGNL